MGNYDDRLHQKQSVELENVRGYQLQEQIRQNHLRSGQEIE